MPTRRNTTRANTGLAVEDAELASSSNPASLQQQDNASDANQTVEASLAGPAAHDNSAALQTTAAAANESLNMDIIQRLDAMKTAFDSKFEGVLQAIKEVKADVRSFSSRMDEAEQRISNVEDTVTTEKSKVDMLAKQIDILTNKIDEMENRSRRCNVRLVNLPPVEADDPVGFITKWLPEALGATTFPAPLIIEAAHRLPGRERRWRSNRPQPPKVFILKFLNFQDKVRAMKAARAKGKVMCGDHQVMFFPDLSAELHRRRRRFDPVKQQLKSLNIRYGLFFPAKLRVWTNGQTREFETPEEAEKFVQGIHQEEPPDERREETTDGIIEEDGEDGE